MSRTKKQPTLDDLEAQIRALQAQRDDRKKALEAEEKKRKAAEAEKRKGDLQLVGNKIGAAAVKLGLADLIYDGKLPMAAVEAALKALLAVPVTPATLGPEVLVEVAAPVGMVEPEGVTG